ncbi:hypothetical protein [Pseudanabaena sp. lw0831]|uniref:hypothetical protein n=1 Tax=Pseudanabaena sp. lw0831 TaxID=1357935 RepID=UPI001914E63C|nr:hypothetical protein [Pseudanabaena sp. lw0831]
MLPNKLIRLRILTISLATGFLVLFAPLLSDNLKSEVNAQSINLPSVYVGVWEGRGSQNNGSGWSILMALTSGEPNSIVGTFAYPSLSCGGKLTLRRVSPQFIELSENLDYGKKNCVNYGTVTLEKTSGESLQYKWFHSNGKLDGTGSIKKISVK